MGHIQRDSSYTGNTARTYFLTTVDDGKVVRSEPKILPVAQKVRRTVAATESKPAPEAPSPMPLTRMEPLNNPADNEVAFENCEPALIPPLKLAEIEVPKAQEGDGEEPFEKCEVTTTPPIIKPLELPTVELVDEGEIF